MREIKYRAQRKDNSEWITGNYVFDRDRHYISPSIFIMEREIENEEDVEENDELPVFMDGMKLGMFHLVIPETVGQYTGLKDKNGVEIYERDILTSDFYPFNDNGMSNYVGVVTWIFSSWQIVLKCVNPLKSGISNGINHDLSEYIGDSDVLNFEVIGNIHSNPELLK